MAYEEVQPNIEAMEAMKSTFRQFNNFKLTEGSNIYRVLPPFGTNNKGVWFHEWYLHWGFMDANGNKRPLACTYRGPERFCPICEEAQELRKQMDALVADWTKKVDDQMKTDWKQVPDDIKAAHKEVRDKWSNIRANRRYYYNAINKAGEVGILQLTAKTGDKLNDLIKVAIQQKNFNPLSLNDGCFFNVTKTKTGPLPINVEYDAKFDYKSQEVTIPSGEKVTADIIERGSVSDALLENFEELAYDIHTLYSVRTAAELQQVLNGEPVPSSNNGSGDTATANGGAEGSTDTSAGAESSSTPEQEASVSDEQRLAELQKALGQEV